MRRLLILVAGTALAACGASPERKPLPEPVTDARDTYELAVETFSAGRYRDAIAGFHRAERRFLSIDDPRGIAAAAISRAEIQLLLGEDDDAAESLRHTGPAIARIDNDQLRERAQLLKARLVMDDNATAARQLLNELDDAMTPAVAAQARLLLCELQVRQGETQCASSLPAGDTRTSARIAHLQARVALQHGDLALANTKLDQALGLYHALAFRPGIAAVHETSAVLALRENNRETAREHFERALYLRLWIRDRVHAAEILGQFADLVKPGEARERYRRWRQSLLDESVEPDWEKMMARLFSSR